MRDIHIDMLVKMMSKEMYKVPGPNEAAAVAAAYFKTIRSWDIDKKFAPQESATADFIDSRMNDKNCLNYMDFDNYEDHTPGLISPNTYESRIIWSLAKSTGCRVMCREVYVVVGHEVLTHLCEKIASRVLERLFLAQQKYLNSLIRFGVLERAPRRVALSRFSQGWSSAFEAKTVPLKLPRVFQSVIDSKVEKMSSDWEVLELRDDQSLSFRAT